MTPEDKTRVLRALLTINQAGLVRRAAVLLGNRPGRQSLLTGEVVNRAQVRQLTAVLRRLESEERQRKVKRPKGKGKGGY